MRTRADILHEPRRSRSSAASPARTGRATGSWPTSCAPATAASRCGRATATRCSACVRGLARRIEEPADLVDVFRRSEFCPEWRVSWPDRSARVCSSSGSPRPRRGIVARESGIDLRRERLHRGRPRGAAVKPVYWKPKYRRARCGERAWAKQSPRVSRISPRTQARTGRTVLARLRGIVDPAKIVRTGVTSHKGDHMAYGLLLLRVVVGSRRLGHGARRSSRCSAARARETAGFSARSGSGPRCDGAARARPSRCFSRSDSSPRSRRRWRVMLNAIARSTGTTGSGHQRGYE